MGIGVPVHAQNNECSLHIAALYLGITQRMARGVGSKCCYPALKNCPLKQPFGLWRQSLVIRKDKYTYLTHLEIFSMC